MSRAYENRRRIGVAVPVSRDDPRGGFNGLVSEKCWGVDGLGRAFDGATTIFHCDHAHATIRSAEICARDHILA